MTLADAVTWMARLAGAAIARWKIVVAGDLAPVGLENDLVSPELAA